MGKPKKAAASPTPPEPIRKWAKLNEEEWTLVREHRVIKLGNPDDIIHWFTIVGTEDFADQIAEVINTALESRENDSFEGDLKSFVMKAAKAPQIRKQQYMVLLQHIEKHFGPRNAAEHKFYFGSN